MNKLEYGVAEWLKISTVVRSWLVRGSVLSATTLIRCLLAPETHNTIHIAHRSNVSNFDGIASLRNLKASSKHRKTWIVFLNGSVGAVRVNVVDISAVAGS